jgi:hypothetical protein
MMQGLFMVILFYYTMKFKVPGTMTEGTVPVPPARPCAERDGSVLPSQAVSHLGGAEAAGGNPVSVKISNIFYEDHSIQL